MSSAKHYMPLYVGDYLADTAHLTTVEHGAYLLLIMHYWRNGELPDDENMLARIARCTPREWKKLRDNVAAFFDEGWKHSRIDAELEKAQSAYERRAKAGRKGGKAKAEIEQCSSNAIPMPKQPEPEPDVSTNVDTLGRASRLPKDWCPNDSEYEFAMSEGLNPDQVDREANKFRDYWHAKGGKDGRKLDWTATWRNWIRNSRDRGGAKPAGEQTRVGSELDALFASGRG